MKIFYNKNQTSLSNDSYSPSATKPALVMEQWANKGVDVVSDFQPATREDFYLAHTSEYVDGVLDLTICNGFHNKNEDVRNSLPWTTGSFVSAALHAFKTGEWTASPTSGFHHAKFGYGGGFCTFNGLMVAAEKLKEEGAKRVGILDLDAHYGDGTDDIIIKKSIKYIEHYTFGAEISKFDNNDEWLFDLEESLQGFKDCDVILYQAGADPHENDPLGGYLSTEDMRRRDEIVFKFCKENNIPVVWNLAGGYQSNIQDVLDIHNQTLEVCLETLGGKHEEETNSNTKSDERTTRVS